MIHIQFLNHAFFSNSKFFHIYFWQFLPFLIFKMVFSPPSHWAIKKDLFAITRIFKMRKIKAAKNWFKSPLKPGSVSLWSARILNLIRVVLFTFYLRNKRIGLSIIHHIFIRFLYEFYCAILNFFFSISWVRYVILMRNILFYLFLILNNI